MGQGQLVEEGSPGRPYRRRLTIVGRPVPLENMVPFDVDSVLVEQQIEPPMHMRKDRACYGVHHIEGAWNYVIVRL